MNRLYRAKKRGESGLSLIELMIALAVIGIALLAMLTMMLNSMNLKEVQRQRALAKQATVAKLEEIKAQDFDFINLQYGPGGPDNTFTVDGLLNPANQAIFGDIQARGVIAIDATNPDLLDLRVVVTWEGVGGHLLTYEGRSMYTE